MSETPAARGGSSRGRGGFRGGRGAYRGTRTTSRSKREEHEQENIPPSTSLDDQGEVGELKRKYGDKVPLIREVCPGWSDEDLVFALQETNGDAEAAIDRISSGTISQWGEVKKKQPKSKEAGPPESGTGRGRGRGSLEGRGRGRGAERGARGARGARAASHANGTKSTTTKTADDGWADAVPTATESTGAWDSAPTNGDSAAAAATAAATDWANEPGQDSLASLQTEEAKPAAAAVPAPTKKAGGWAGLFAKPPPAPKPAPTTVPAAQPQEPPSIVAPTSAPEELPLSDTLQPPPIEPQIVEDGPSELPSAPHSETAGDLPPGKDELTETNLEQLPDESHPPASQTVASTTASTQDPLAQAQAQSSKQPIRPMSGYAATALKATAGAGRSASFNRKVMEQQEAVVMPGNHAVEKAAVQFGKMGLNGDGDLDVDEDREEPETRTPLPDDSPSAPRASLPPTHPESQAAPAPVESHLSQEAQLPRQAPGLPPAPQQPAQSAGHASGYTDPYRYGQTGKTYDPFAQPASQPQPQQPSSQEPFSNQVPGQAQPGSSQNDFASYYGRDPAAYQQYYAQYAQSHAQGQGQGQDAQRTGSAFGTSSQEAQSQYATARPQQGYGQHDAQGSGQNTPAPNVSGHQNQHSQHMGSQGSHGAGYPYGYPAAAAYNQQYPQYGNNYMNQMTAAQHRYGSNRPMFDDARRQEDFYGSQGQQQYGYAHNQHYGGSYKSSMYGQPQSQQYSYEHSSSPANATGFGARDAMYGRSGSTQPSEAQQSGATAHGYSGMPDPFGRSASGFGQSQGLSQQHGGHQGSEDTSKPTGPSPSVQSGRPGSTVNSSQAQQGGFPPQSQTSSQQAFGGYPQYGSGFGNFGGQQNAHQTAAGYGQYGSNAFGSYGSAGGYSSGRGWNH